MKISLKSILFIFWLSVVATIVYFFLKSGMTFIQLRSDLQNMISAAGPGATIAYVAIYSIRSLIFFPASLLTAVAGLFFGPWIGLFLTVIGENISANISFTLGRYFGKDFLGVLGTKFKFLPSFRCKLQENGFMSVLVMRLTYLPFDLVGYSSGMCGLRRKDFALATFLGTIPGLATFVLLGSSLTDFRNMIFAFVFFVLGLVLSRYLKSRKKVSDFQVA